MNISQLMSKARAFIMAHKIWSAIILIVALYGIQNIYARMTSTAGETRYVLGTAQKGTVIRTVTGSGQVSTLSQLDIKPKVSGDVVSVLVAQGDTVKAGQALVRLDSTQAQKDVRDAEVSLETAKLNLEKTLQPPDQLSLTQSENTLANSITSKDSAEDSLAKAYNDGYNEISNAFLDLPTIVSGLHDLLYLGNSQLGGSNVNNIDFYSRAAGIYDERGITYGADTDAKYQIALAKYNKNFLDYKSLDRSAATGTIEAMLAETYDTTLAIADAVKSTNNLIQFYEDQMTQHNQKIPSLANTQLTTLNNYTGTSNSHLSTLLSLQTSIKSNKNSLEQSLRQIDVNTQSLANLKAGADPLDIRNQEIVVTQKQDALTDAQTTLSYYTVRAAFGGTIAKVNVKVGDSAGSGSAVATLVANQKIAELSLNEIDAAKVKVGQKATLTFDAVEGLSISGEVATIDTLGTVSQGVVTYAVQINFDTQDARVKSGMSVNATIQTDVKPDVLTVPASAVKTQGGNSYVLVFDTPITAIGGTQGVVSAIAPRQQPVVTGLSDDTLTEIVSGLKEGEQVVTRTIAGTAQTTTASAPSLLPTGGNRSGGAVFRGG